MPRNIAFVVQNEKKKNKTWDFKYSQLYVSIDNIVMHNKTYPIRCKASKIQKI